MTLRRKTILAMSLTLVGLIVLLGIVLLIIILNSYSTLETQVTLRSLDRASNNLQDIANNLQRAIHDWSSWDESYQFVQGDNPDYIDANMGDDTFWTLDINLMMFVNTSNQIVYAKALDIDSDWTGDFLPQFEDYVNSDARFLREITSTPTAGFVVVDGLSTLIASRPILRNDDSGPKAGTLIWVRNLGVNELLEVSQSLRQTVDLRIANAPDLPDDFRAVQSKLSPVSSRMVVPLSHETVAGYALVNDIYQQPALLLRTSLDRDIYWQGQASLVYFIAALILVGVVFGAAALVMLDRLILSRLTQLSERVRHIGIDDNFTMRLPVNGNDELTQLALAINAMLNTVSQSRAALQEMNSQLENRVSERTTELEFQKSRLQSIMDTMGEGLVYCVDEVIEYANGALLTLLGATQSEIVGKPFRSLLMQEDMLLSLKSYQRCETTITRNDGTNLHVALTSASVDHRDDQQSCVVIIRDITREVESKAQKERFFARASHDLRSPLTSLMTRLYLLEKKPEQLDKHLKVLNSVSDRMLELVNDLLEVTRAEQGAMVLKKRDLVLQTVADEVLEVQEADAEVCGIRLITDYTESPLRIYGDPLRLNQVITNLLSNAIHYTPEGGEIVVRIEKEERDGANYGVLRVRDGGAGISPENLAHIFEPFFRVDDNPHQGTGLGLYIVQQIVGLHGGEISVESEVGAGTTFTVRLALSNGSGDYADTEKGFVVESAVESDD